MQMSMTRLLMIMKIDICRVSANAVKRCHSVFGCVNLDWPLASAGSRSISCDPASEHTAAVRLRIILGVHLQRPILVVAELEQRVRPIVVFFEGAEVVQRRQSFCICQIRIGATSQQQLGEPAVRRTMISGESPMSPTRTLGSWPSSRNFSMTCLHLAMQAAEKAEHQNLLTITEIEKDQNSHFMNTTPMISMKKQFNNDTESPFQMESPIEISENAEHHHLQTVAEIEKEDQNSHLMSLLSFNKTSPSTRPPRVPEYPVDGRRDDRSPGGRVGAYDSHIQRLRAGPPDSPHDVEIFSWSRSTLGCPCGLLVRWIHCVLSRALGSTRTGTRTLHSDDVGSY
ncbi:unnamed protein product [Trichogramma brassicae]|uniref:Uncharacterized protein n=1 Tax=Trichogramma brassicae TaxID=86971 RepID=A0A6H5I3G6_9HYME|nr:unnamed protein product [Trichogramma brassicae]